jgi:hypothetical protein
MAAAYVSIALNNMKEKLSGIPIVLRLGNVEIETDEIIYNILYIARFIKHSK